MTLPNKITVSRIVGTPIFYIVFLATQKTVATNPTVAQMLVTFLATMWIIMEISDLVDGYLARKHRLVSDMGKILDPFSDVLSRVTYFFCFVQMGFMPMWPLLVIFWRELSITFIRAVMAMGGVTLAANNGGKMKAVFYFVVSLLGMALLVSSVFSIIPESWGQPLYILSYAIFTLAAVASVSSFMGYMALFLKTDYAQKFLKE